MDKIRCPACRGSKRIAGIGGIVKKCKTCDGTGKINAIDKPKPVLPVEDTAIDVVQAVQNMQLSNQDEFNSDFNVEKPVKVDGKKASYKRKRA